MRQGQRITYFKFINYNMYLHDFVTGQDEALALAYGSFVALLRCSSSKLRLEL